MAKELDMISGSEMAFHIDNYENLPFDNEENHIMLKCEIGKCNYQIQCSGPFESTSSLDIYKGLFGTLLYLKKSYLQEFLYHIQNEHLINELHEHNLAPSWRTSSPLATGSIFAIFKW